MKKISQSLLDQLIGCSGEAAAEALRNKGFDSRIRREGAIFITLLRVDFANITVDKNNKVVKISLSDKRQATK
jgi:hypothetical protein